MDLKMAYEELFTGSERSSGTGRKLCGARRTGRISEPTKYYSVEGL